MVRCKGDSPGDTIVKIRWGYGFYDVEIKVGFKWIGSYCGENCKIDDHLGSGTVILGNGVRIFAQEIKYENGAEEAIKAEKKVAGMI